MQDKFNICEHDSCTACSACQSICHKHAIRMITDDEGFQYPHINEDSCVDCGLCIKICPANKKQDVKSSYPQQPYLAWINDDEVRLDSSSGGIFTAVARYVISKKGVVCGAAYDNDMTVRHRIVDNEKDLKYLRGSKYVQSITEGIFPDIKEYLNKGVMVYFVGTPCQIAGLNSFLKKKYENLLTSDLICHGVPSGNLFKEQIKHFEKKKGEKIVDVKFRSKKRFGQGCDFQIITNIRGGEFFCAELVPYFNGFWKNITLRESCYKCQYASLNREGDITLADFWLVKKCFPDVRTSKGTSLVFVNSIIGESILMKLANSGDIYMRKATIEQALLGQGQLKCPVPRPKERDGYKRYDDFEKYCNGLLKTSLGYKIKMHLRNAIKILILFKYWK